MKRRTGCHYVQSTPVLDVSCMRLIYKLLPYFFTSLLARSLDRTHNVKKRDGEGLSIENKGMEHVQILTFYGQVFFGFSPLFDSSLLWNFLLSSFISITSLFPLFSLSTSPSLSLFYPISPLLTLLLRPYKKNLLPQ